MLLLSAVQDVTFLCQLNSKLELLAYSLKLSLLQQKQSLYASADEFQDLVKEVLSWDIRSLSQRIRPHEVTIKDVTDNGRSKIDNGCNNDEDRQSVDSSTSVVYHLHLEGIDVSYRIDQDSNIVVENAALLSSAVNQHQYNYLTWREKVSIL
jgi:hypothetical protein